jgi:hypothetical protein
VPRGTAWQTLNGLAETGKAVEDRPRVRVFRQLGWSIVLVPMSLDRLGGVPRSAARMMIGTLYGFRPDEVIPMSARTLTMDSEQPSLWWVFAIPLTALERRRREAST